MLILNRGLEADLFLMNIVHTYLVI